MASSMALISSCFPRLMIFAISSRSSKISSFFRDGVEDWVTSLRHIEIILLVDTKASERRLPCPVLNMVLDKSICNRKGEA